MNIAVATYPRLYVRPMEKHELELVTSTCTMSCNVLLSDCTRHMSLGPLHGIIREELHHVVATSSIPWVIQFGASHTTMSLAGGFLDSNLAVLGTLLSIKIFRCICG
jgi:hypothetical protein